jgi:hypothetical protein
MLNILLLQIDTGSSNEILLELSLRVSVEQTALSNAHFTYQHDVDVVVFSTGGALKSIVRGTVLGDIFDAGTLGQTVVLFYTGLWINLELVAYLVDGD